MSNQKLSGQLTSELFSSGAVAVMDRTMSFDALTGQFAVGRSQAVFCSVYCTSKCTRSCHSRDYTRRCR